MHTFEGGFASLTSSTNSLPPILLLLQLIAFDDEMDVAEVDHFTYYCDVHLICLPLTT